MASNETSSQSGIKLTPELFCINHLQYFVETRYAFLQTLPTEKAARTLKTLPLERPEFDKILSEPQQHELKNRRSGLAAAAVAMTFGNYRRALDAVEYAESSYRTYFAQDHITRLEISSFRALLLALNSRPVEAEELCQRTLSVLSEGRGYAHPLTLVTTGIMVLIQIKLWQFFPALDTAATLTQRANEILGDNSILTLHSRVLLAAAKFHAGEYCRSEADLESVIPILEQSLHGGHPDMFQYQCLLARVYLKRGKFDAAERRLVSALETKLQEYSKKSNPNGAIGASTDNAEIPEIKLSDFVRAFREDPSAAFLNKKPHPEFLKALSLLADILFQQQSVPDFAISIHKAVWWQEKAELGDSHLDTVTTLSRFAVLTRDFRGGYETDKVVREQLEHVVKVRTQALGSSHAATLCAQREWFILGHSMKSLINPGLWAENEERSLIYFQGRDVFAESHNIYETHKSYIGRLHPETLQSLHWLFKIEISKGFHEQTTALTGELLICLRAVRKDSPVFALSLECSIAFTFYEFGYYRTARQISMKTSESIDVCLASEGQEMRPFLERLKVENRGFIDHLRDKMEEVRR
ncbi:hypothetical protein F4805DRAFT_477114 [Annulohypoxylon moriforme]|nr:hypothetical protein F4805DRAFT_477114 [Annulohypoxylon moriforme]